MDGEARHHRVEDAERRERRLEVVRHDLDAVRSGEARAQPVEHRRREVEGDAARLGAAAQHQIEQAAVARAEVEHAARAGGQVLEQLGLAFGAMRDGVGAGEVGLRVLGGPPLVRHG